jgi:hypothetical protein
MQIDAHELAGKHRIEAYGANPAGGAATLW